MPFAGASSLSQMDTHADETLWEDGGLLAAAQPNKPAAAFALNPGPRSCESLLGGRRIGMGAALRNGGRVHTAFHAPLAASSDATVHCPQAGDADTQASTARGSLTVLGSGLSKGLRSLRLRRAMNAEQWFSTPLPASFIGEGHRPQHGHENGHEHEHEHEHGHSSHCGHRHVADCGLPEASLPRLHLATSFGGHGHGHGHGHEHGGDLADQVWHNWSTCMLALMASTAAWINAYVAYNIEKENYERDLHEIEEFRRDGGPAPSEGSHEWRTRLDPR
mmetsp:Transcript_11057/g.29236  ORF Transcript_11057/g.29236 Transcript_11057/m.29236 type:complete len:277 (-) Transcript_11057:37-867(-)